MTNQLENMQKSIEELDLISNSDLFQEFDAFDETYADVKTAKETEDYIVDINVLEPTKTKETTKETTNDADDTFDIDSLFDDVLPDKLDMDIVNPFKDEVEQKDSKPISINQIEDLFENIITETNSDSNIVTIDKETSTAKTKQVETASNDDDIFGDIGDEQPNTAVIPGLTPVTQKTKPTTTKAKAKPVEVKTKSVEAKTKIKPVEVKAKPVEVKVKPVEAKAKPVETKPTKSEKVVDEIDILDDILNDIPNESAKTTVSDKTPTVEIESDVKPTLFTKDDIDEIESTIDTIVLNAFRKSIKKALHAIADELK